MMNHVHHSLFLLLFLLFTNSFSIATDEKQLFTVSLKKSEKPSTLLEFNRKNGLRGVINGPIVLSNSKFLFMSEDGYVLFNRDGSIIDSHSVYKENANLAPNDSFRIKLAFPSDLNTIIYYQRTRDAEAPIKLYFKKIGKGRLKELKSKNGNPYKEIENGELQNIMFNTITDEMASTFMSQKYLAGYRAATKMWTLDSYYSSTSPIIVSQDENFVSFYPGVRMGKSKNHQLLVNPLQAFNKNGKWYYTGIHSNVGASDSISYQKVFFYDQAGNALWSDTILKQENENAIIGEDSQTYYTAKKIKKYVYIPSLDSSGNLYYGIYDFKKGVIQVVEKTYSNIKSKKCDPLLKDLVKKEQTIEMKPVQIACGREAPGKQIADVTLIDNKGRRVSGQIRHLEKEGFIVRISRVQYRDIYRKLARKRTDIPMYVSLFMDSLSESNDAGCPFYISLSGPKGMIRSFDYPFGTTIASARVLAVNDKNDVVIRVDCLDFAEIIILNASGQFKERFTFNNQKFKKRKDIIVADKSGKIIELDYESSPETGQYFSWEN